MYRIESLLSARLFLVPQVVEDRIYFVSNMSGKLSLYSMDIGGSVPQPLLPPEISLFNPHLMGPIYHVFPDLGKILIMIDRDGNEDYKPMVIPLDGGYPEPAFGSAFDGFRVRLGRCFPEKNIAYLSKDSRKEALTAAYKANLENGRLDLLHKGKYGAYPSGINNDHTMVALIEDYEVADHVVYLWEQGNENSRTIYGTPIDQRETDNGVELNGISACHFIRSNQALIFCTTLFEDTGGLGIFELEDPSRSVKPVSIKGILHHGIGEFYDLEHLKDDRYLAYYNIDGCDWVYEAVFDEEELFLHLDKVLVGQGELSNGVLEYLYYDEKDNRFSLSYSTATSTTQIYTITGSERSTIQQHTKDKFLGLSGNLLSPGEDASFTSFDGLRISARLYMPQDELGYMGPRPLVYYIHGGPQGQERPDFAWFSMPLIQYLTLNGFAVFVPNVRGSSGYGLSFIKKVDRDWGGNDRLDHVHAMTVVLPEDERIDTSRAAVIGRSYGGFMTLTLASRHPELWSASCDMFGPYNLFTFLERLPESWKPYFHIALGHPEKDKDFLQERSPQNYVHNIAAPMLVIQGKNDPRVIEQESRDLVEQLRKMGKEVDYLMFENEGHDILKFENRVICYNAITDFFKKHLLPDHVRNR